MSLLKNNFNELFERIRHGREFAHASFEPIYYLIFSPTQIVDVKRHMPAWTAKLQNEGWTVHTFSIAENILDILENIPLRRIWLTADSRSPLNWEKTNQSLANALSSGALESRLEAKLIDIQEDDKAVLLVTDLEALHPYMRIGTIESSLHGEFKVPTVFLYPGERAGNTKLKFLGFYPEDGNYRSVHVGG